MTLKDISNGPEWVMWSGFVLLLLLSILLLTGRGAWLIAGYNTASKDEKSKYDEKKICRVTGIGLLVVAIFVFIMAIGESVLPAVIAYVFTGVVLIDCVIMMVLTNTICKK